MGNDPKAKPKPDANGKSRPRESQELGIGGPLRRVKLLTKPQKAKKKKKAKHLFRTPVRRKRYNTTAKLKEKTVFPLRQQKVEMVKISWWGRHVRKSC